MSDQRDEEFERHREQMLRELSAFATINSVLSVKTSALDRTRRENLELLAVHALDRAHDHSSRALGVLEAMGKKPEKKRGNFSFSME
jgi:hypothetical protein